jgi:hypothetical protein
LKNLIVARVSSRWRRRRSFSSLIRSGLSASLGAMMKTRQPVQFLSRSCPSEHRNPGRSRSLQRRVQAKSRRTAATTDVLAR